VLLEALLAIALFVGAAGFTLAATRGALQAVDRHRRSLEAVDLARSKMAELEAGFISVEDLRGDGNDGVGSTGRAGPPRDASESSRWRTSVKTQRSEFTGLTLVELTVAETDDRPLDDSGAPVSFTLRQLVPLGDAGEATETESATAGASFEGFDGFFAGDRP
jgi:hypothetical protein